MTQDGYINGANGGLMKATYRNWLEQQKYDLNTVNAQMYRAGRV